MMDSLTRPSSELLEAIEQAQMAVAELDFSTANQILEESIRSASEVSEALELARLLLAETSLVIGRWERAQRELERLAERSHSRQNQVKALISLSELFSMRGEPDQAKTFLGRALPMLEEPGWELLLADSLIRLAALGGKTGEVDNCKSLLDRAETLRPSLVSDRNWAEVVAALDTQWGLLYFRQSQVARAEEHFHRALASLRQGSYLSLSEAHLLRYLGVMASLRRQPRASLAYHLEALARFNAAGHRFGQAKTYDSIGRTLQGANRLEEAILAFKKSESLCRRLGAQAELATLYGKLGQVAMLREDLEGAIRYFEKDLELSSRYRNYYALGYSYRNLGRCLLQVGRFDEAVINLKESIGLFQFVEDWVNLARVYMDLGFAQAKAGQLPEARDVRARAGQLFQERNLQREQIYLACLDGILERAENRFESAEKHFRLCIEALTGAGNGNWLAETFCELGVLYRNFGRIDQATEAFKQAVSTARQAGLYRQVGRYLQELESLDEIELFKVWMEDLPDQATLPVQTL